MDKFSLEAALLNDKYNAEEAEMIADDFAEYLITTLKEN